MPRPNPIGDERLVVRWIKQGWSYAKIQEEHEKMFSTRPSISTINNVRKRNGLPPRIVRNQDLLPWKLSKEHERTRDATYLRVEARLRAGLPVNDQHYRGWDKWRRQLTSAGLVVDYDPVQGFRWVAPRPGVDDDLVRVPDKYSARGSY